MNSGRPVLFCESNMAFEWIKFRPDLETHPRFLALCKQLSDCPGLVGYVDGSNENSNETVTTPLLYPVTGPVTSPLRGALRDVTQMALLRVWSVVNAHCSLDGDDAIMDPWTPEDVDEIARFSGFCAAMIAVGWIRPGRGKCLIFPNFREFNEPACTRRRKRPAKTNAERQATYRAKKKAEKEAQKASSGEITHRNESVTHQNVTSNGREEERREEYIQQQQGADIQNVETPGDELCSALQRAVGARWDTGGYFAKVMDIMASLTSTAIVIEGEAITAERLLTAAISDGAKNGAKFRSPLGLEKYLRSIVERCISDHAWPGDFDDGQSGKGQNRTNRKTSQKSGTAQDRRADRRSNECGEVTDWLQQKRGNEKS